MLFQISTPQTVGEYVAMQELRKASRRKSAQCSDMEPSAKKQKLLHGSLPPAPAPANGTTNIRPTDEKPNLVGCSLPLGWAQAHDKTTLEPSTKKRKPDDSSVALAQGHCMANHGLAIQKPGFDHGSLPLAQAHDMTDLEPATKKPKLSYASLRPARVQDRASSVDCARAEAEYYRKGLQGKWCELHGFDYHLLDQSTLADTVLMSPNFDPFDYMATQSSKVHSYTYGASELDLYPVDDSSLKNLMAESAKFDAHSIHRQNLGDLSGHSPAPCTALQVHPVPSEVSSSNTPAQSAISQGRPGSENETSHPPSVRNTTAKAYLTFGGRPNEEYPSLGDQTSMSFSSMNSTPMSPVCSSSDPNMEHNTTPASSYQIISVGSDREMGDNTAAASSDRIPHLPPYSNLRGDTAPVSSSPVGPARNKGGRPRGRKPRPPKIPKGPTRFQKNHPVNARVNIDIWENILFFCPPDFLLKARTISPTFRSVLKDDSPIWKRARVNHFGLDMPDPPSDLSEPQYADLLTGIGCQTRSCESTKTRKTYWAFQKRLCIDCFQKAFLPPRALRRVFKELETSETPQYRSIAQYYQNMEEYLPGMKFDRWDNYQWLGNYDPTPSWGQLYRSGQYTGYPAAAYANFSSELAVFVGNEYDVEHGHFSSHEPMPGKTCPPQDAIDAWFEAKRAANDALVPQLQAVEDWYESCKRDNQKAGKDFRKDRERFYEEQAELAGLNTTVLKNFKSYQAAIAISKPASIQSWKILLPKIMAEYERAKKLAAEAEWEAVKQAARFKNSMGGHPMRHPMRYPM